MNRVLITSLATLALAGLAGCGDERTPPDDSGRPIKMFTVGEATSDWKREYPGTVAAAQEVEIGFEVPGQITARPVVAGQKLKAGDLIAKLDKTNYQATLDAAKGQVRTAESDAERKKELNKIGGASGAAVEEAERRLTLAKSDLETAEKAMSDTELRAPFDGLVARTLVENFSNVQAKQPIVTFQDPSWLEIVVNVSEADAALAVPGLSLEERNRRIAPQVVVSAIEDRKFPAQITEFSTTADPAMRTYAVTLVFARPDDISVLPGMTARVEIAPKEVNGGSSGIRVPSQSVAGDNSSKPYVWVISADGKAARRSVKLGEIAGSMAQIQEGLKTGERIALNGVHHLREGLLVREWEAE